MHLTRFAVLIALLCCLSYGTAQAQAPAADWVAASAEQLRATAALRTPSVANSVASTVQPAALAVARSGRRAGEVLMIVGGAGIIVGILADESLITIAGAAVGGYGLYLYLR